MRHYHLHSRGSILAWIVIPTLLATPLFAQDQPQPPPVPQEELPEVLTRGPIHEAFAEPIPLNNQEPLSVQPAPPPLIDEQPPEERPQGNYVWVPGYWAWDQDRNGYIWVSACWRAAPPGMYWVPGYWVQNEDRWDWVSGFWAPAQETEIEYLPPPPQLEDVMPPGPQPENAIWVSPCWYWYSGQYILRQGYWLNAQPDWVWQPSHYVWTPRGYVFVQGHWDYTLERRGVLYAPVYFPRSYYSRPSYIYTPSVVVDLAIVTGFLFTYPRYNHYCFGDYYDSSYIGFGIYPWYESTRYSSWYDPLYRHHRWSHREDSKWEDRIRDTYNRRTENRDLRPPRTQRDWDQKKDQLSDEDRRQYRLTRSWREVTTDRDRPVPTQRLDAESRRALVKQSGEIQQLRRDRGTWEAVDGKPAAGAPDAVQVPEGVRIRDARPDRSRPGEADDDRTGPATPATVPKTSPQTPPETQPTAPVIRRDDRPGRQPDDTPPKVQPVPAPKPPIETQPTTPTIRREDRPARQPDETPDVRPPVLLPQPQPKSQPQPRQPRQQDVQPVPKPQPQLQPQLQPQVQPVPKVQPQPQPQPQLQPQPQVQPVPKPQPQLQPQPRQQQPRQREVQPVPAPQQPGPAAQPAPSTPRVRPVLPGPDGQPEPVRQPRVRVTQPERVKVPESTYTQPPAVPAPVPGLETPPEPEPEIIRRERGGRP